FYLSARDMLTQGTVPLVGIPSSRPWLHQGPWWTYILAISLWMGNFHPLAGVYLRDRKSTRLNSSHSQISYAVFCLKKKTNKNIRSARDLGHRHRRRLAVRAVAGLVALHHRTLRQTQ